MRTTKLPILVLLLAACSGRTGVEPIDEDGGAGAAGNHGGKAGAGATGGRGGGTGASGGFGGGTGGDGNRGGTGGVGGTGGFGGTGGVAGRGGAAGVGGDAGRGGGGTGGFGGFGGTGGFAGTGGFGGIGGKGGSAGVGGFSGGFAGRGGFAGTGGFAGSFAGSAGFAGTGWQPDGGPDWDAPPPPDDAPWDAPRTPWDAPPPPWDAPPPPLDAGYVPTWDTPTCPADGSGSPLLGTWIGYIENFQLPSGSDALKLVVTSADAQSLCGTLTFGDTTPLPPPNPDVGYPPNLVPGKWIAQQLPIERFPHTLFSGVVAGKRVRFKNRSYEPAKQWCELQTSYWGGWRYSCADTHGGWLNTVLDAGANSCSYSNGWMSWPVDCGKAYNCTEWHICQCDATKCGADTIYPIDFDAQFDAAEARGSIVLSTVGSGQVYNVYFTKSP